MNNFKIARLKIIKLEKNCQQVNSTMLILQNKYIDLSDTD